MAKQTERRIQRAESATDQTKFPLYVVEVQYTQNIREFYNNSHYIVIVM